VRYDEFQQLLARLNDRDVIGVLAERLKRSAAGLRVALMCVGSESLSLWGSLREWWLVDEGDRKAIRVGSPEWKEAWRKATRRPWKESDALRMLHRWADDRDVYETREFVNDPDFLARVRALDPEHLTDRDREKLAEMGMLNQIAKGHAAWATIGDTWSGPVTLQPGKIVFEDGVPMGVVMADGEVAKKGMVSMSNCPSCGGPARKPAAGKCYLLHPDPTLVERLAMAAMEEVRLADDRPEYTPIRYCDVRDRIVERLRVILMS